MLTCNQEEVLAATSYVYNDIIIKVSCSHLLPKFAATIASPKFRKWLDDFNKEEIDIREFILTDVDFFGKISPEKLGFVKGYGIAFDRTSGEQIPAIAFLRGDAVAILIVVTITETGKRYVLMCKQLRFPCGRSLVEACAGMIDDKTKNVTGVVFKEVQEETGFVIAESSLIALGSIRPSGGGCDEIIHLYAWETEIGAQEFAEKQERIYGAGPLEKIKLLFYPFDAFDDEVDALGDVKAECAWRRYLKHKARQQQQQQEESGEVHHHHHHQTNDTNK